MARGVHSEPGSWDIFQLQDQRQILPAPSSSPAAMTLPQTRLGEQELHWGWKMGSTVALPQAPHGPAPFLGSHPRCCLRVTHRAARTEIQGGHKTLPGKQVCEGHMKDNHRNKMGLFLKYQHKPRQFDRG